MPKSRIKTRDNKRKEQVLNKNNEYGINDPTPYKAIKLIVEKKGV